MRSIAILLVLSAACSNTGYITGSAVHEGGSFSPADVEYVEGQVVLLVCPKLRRHLKERDCTMNLLREMLVSIELDFLGGGIDYQVWFEPLEDE